METKETASIMETPTFLSIREAHSFFGCCIVIEKRASPYTKKPDYLITIKRNQAIG